MRSLYTKESSGNEQLAYILIAQRMLAFMKKWQVNYFGMNKWVNLIFWSTHDETEPIKANNEVNCVCKDAINANLLFTSEFDKSFSVTLSRRFLNFFLWKIATQF